MKKKYIFHLFNSIVFWAASFFSKQYHFMGNGIFFRKYERSTQSLSKAAVSLEIWKVDALKKKQKKQN